MATCTSRFVAPMIVVVVLLAAGGWLTTAGGAQTMPAGATHTGPLFQSATYCMACHNGLTTPSGEDVSIGSTWRASMMAHSALDPYWQAGVRREVIDHPLAQKAIENECSRCHMPMAHVQAQARHSELSVFANVAHSSGASVDPLAAEGVSCALCHQIANEQLGQRTSFNGGFAVDIGTPLGERHVFGPYEVDAGRISLMHSASGFRPAEAKHIQQSEVCATCHTLYTHPLDSTGRPVGEFPEQVPYQEWVQSTFRQTHSCQSCHMPVIEQPTPISSVLPHPRDGVSRHDFRGGNFFMLGLLNRFRQQLGVVAKPAELNAAVTRTKAFLQSEAATLSVTRLERVGGRLETDIVVRNLSGHKLPTAYPSRRVWLYVTVRNDRGQTVFSSGQPQTTGAIAGNDNDRDASLFEPHHREITSGDQVQIYEAIMATHARTVTTGLLSAVGYLKDNRLTPKGFDKHTVPGDVAVHGDALADPDFAGGHDVIRYSVDVSAMDGPFTVEAELWYQPIAYRWAENLRAYDAFEPRRFVAFYDSMASSSALMLARATRSTVRVVQP